LNSRLLRAVIVGLCSSFQGRQNFTVKTQP
jgi:hypothetical protein